MRKDTKGKRPQLSLSISSRSGDYNIDLSCTHSEYCEITKQEYWGNKAGKPRDFKKLPKTGKLHAISLQPSKRLSDAFDYEQAKPEEIDRVLKILKQKDIIEPYSEYTSLDNKLIYNPLKDVRLKERKTKRKG